MAHQTPRESATARAEKMLQQAVNEINAMTVRERFGERDGVEILLDAAEGALSGSRMRLEELEAADDAADFWEQDESE